MLFLLGVVFLALGLLAILKPSVMWYLDERWKVKGKFEPSDTYIRFTQFCGAVITTIGILFMIIGFFYLL